MDDPLGAGAVAAAIVAADCVLIPILMDDPLGEIGKSVK